MANKKYTINEQYFENIDTPNKAYVLGLWYADGNNYIGDDNSYRVSIKQCEANKDVIYKIANELDSTYPIKEYIPEKGSHQFILTIYSKKMSEDLTKLGCVPRKSLVLEFPTNIQQNLIPHFIRGYFDGDGCVWNGQRKKMRVKDPSREEGFRERIVHNVKFTFTGNYSFINSLQDYLVKVGIVNKKTKLNFSKAKNPNNTTSENVCTMEYSGRKQLKSLYNFMYKNSTIHCDLKKSKFEEIFCASEERSSEDTSLIAGTPEMVISSEASNIEERSSTIPEMGVESSDSKCEAPNSIEKGEDIVSSAIK